MLEKLLRDSRVGHVYLLLRPRRGRTPAERLAQLLRAPLFHLLRPAAAATSGASSLDPAVLRRVTAVAGDVARPGLGLGGADRALLIGAVDTVVHCAAGALACARRPLSGIFENG